MEWQKNRSDGLAPGDLRRQVLLDKKRDQDRKAKQNKKGEPQTDENLVTISKEKLDELMNK
jgi:hypothetical protein